MRVAPCYRRTTGTGRVLGRLLAPAALALMVYAAPASAAPPANDAFASPQALTGATTSATGTNVDATREPGEPIPADNFGDLEGEGSAWYSWTAPASGTATIDLCLSGAPGSGRIADSELGVYTGSVLSELREAGSNDDFDCPVAGNLLSKVTMPVTGGVAYRISVSSFQGSAKGSFTLSIAQTPDLANDNFASAYLIQTRFNEPDLATVSEGGGTTAGATVEAGEPTASSLRTVWYRWVAERTRPVQISTCESVATARVVVYTGSGSLASLVPVPDQLETTSCVGGHVAPRRDLRRPAGHDLLDPGLGRSRRSAPGRARRARAQARRVAGLAALR